LIQLQIEILQGDNASIQLNSLEEFHSYAEIRPAVTKRVVVTWIYIITFKGKATPERQQIEITFSSVDEGLDSHIRLQRHREGFTFDKSDTGYVDIIISYTARSWGADLEALLSSHVLTYLQTKPKGVPKFLNEFSTFVGFLSGMGIASTLIFLGARPLWWAVSRYSGVIPSVTPTSDILRAVNDKLDTLLPFITGLKGASLSVATVFYAVCLTIAAISGGIYVGEAASTKLPSFLLLSKNDERVRDEKMASYRSSWHRAFANSIIAILIGITSNILFVILW
jgi:hypothetical protein